MWDYDRSTMRKLRLIAAVTLATLATVAVGLWLARDQPRRLAQAALAERLGADVSVGNLQVKGRTEVWLGQVAIRWKSAPGLRQISIGRIVANGGLRDMADGRFQSVRLDDLEIVIDPAAGAVSPTVTGTATKPEVARFEIPAGRLVVLSPDGKRMVEFTAELNHVWSAPTGSVKFESEQLEVDPLFLLAGLDPPDELQRSRVEAVAGEIRLAADEPRLALSVRADRVAVADRPALGVAHIEGTVVEGEPGVFHVEVVPSLPAVGEARVEATFRTTPWRVTRLRALAKEIDAAAWSLPPFDLPPGWSVVGGTIDLEVEGEPVRGLAVAVSAHDLDLTGEIPVRGNLAVTGVLQGVENRAFSGRFELAGRVTRLPAETVGNVILDAVLPATLTGSIDVAAIDRPLTVSLRLDTAAAGILGATGTAGLATPAPLDARWSWSGGELGPLMSRIAPQAEAAVPGGFVVEGGVSARGRLGGDVATPTVSGELEVRDLAVRPGGAANGGPPGWRLSGEHPVARFAWTRAEPTIELEVPDTLLIVAVDPLDPVPVVLQASATLDLERGAARLRHVVVDAGSLGTARLEATWQTATAATARLAVRVEDLNGWLPFAAPVVGDALSDANASGRATLELEATRDGTGWTFGGPIEVAGAGLSAADGSRVVEGFEADALLTGIVGPGNSLKANAAATLGGFQLLWGTHYADFTDRRAVVDVDASRSSDGDATVAVQLELPPHAALAGTFRIAAGEPPAWEGTLTVADIGGFWERYVGVPFQGTLGVAGSLRLEGGELQTQLRGTVGEVATATGEMRLDGLSIGSGDDGSSVENLQIQLPVDLGWAEDGMVEAGEAHRGSLEFDRATVGGVQLAATATELVLLGDTVTMVGDLRLPVFGGEVVLENAGFAELARSSRYLTAAVGLHRISLAEVSRTLGLPPLDGDVTGRFPRVLYSNGILTVDGTGELAVFGGTVTMRDIAGSDLFTRYPHLKFSADWEEIDLALLTRTFDFGTMSGIIEGQLVDCEIFRDVPVRFRGRLRSVPREGVRQRISLKAVNNIAIVGTGSGLGLLDSGLRRFIDSYAYRGIGIEMALSQDHFLLRGLERRGDRELFVKGRFPLRLDVVNVEPGMTVSFRTMIQRLRTLDVTTVTTQQ